MDILNSMILSLNKEEIRSFKLYCSWEIKSNNRKDLSLFDYIRLTGDKYNEAKIIEKLYGKTNDKNSFYRLKNRLIQDISASMVLQHFINDDILSIHQLLSVVKLFADKTQYKVAFHFLNKAEAKAQKTDNYELLDIIYGEYIRLSHEATWKNPEEYIQKRKMNMTELQAMRQIDDILAVVTYRLKLSQNIAQTENSILDILSKAVDEFSLDSKIRQNARLRFKIYHAVSQILLQKHDYVSLEKYLLKTYTEFVQESLFTKQNHETKLQMLTYIVNALSKNNKISEALSYLDLLKAAMNEYERFLYDKYELFYYNSLHYNYAKADPDKAIELLENLKLNKQIRKTNSFYDLFIFLNLAIRWFDKNEFKKSIRNLVELYKHDAYKKADHQLQFKIVVFEMILRYELNDFDFLEHRISQLKKDFKEFLSQKEFSLEFELLEIIKKLTLTPIVKLDKKLKEQILSFIQLSSQRKQGDDAIIHYGNWLLKKM